MDLIASTIGHWIHSDALVASVAGVLAGIVLVVGAAIVWIEREQR